MNTIINDTRVTVNLFDYEQYTDDRYCDTINGQIVKPFALANINLTSDEYVCPLRNKLVCRVDVRLANNLYPKLVFTVAHNPVSDSEYDCGGFTDEFIEDILNDLSDAIQYNELELETV